VVCPVTLMGQWAEELAAKTDGPPKRSTNPMELLDYDVVLTTYQMILMELDFIRDPDDAARGQRHPVPAYHLRRPVRLVLDRDEDMHMTGHRHAFLGKYKVLHLITTHHSAHHPSHSRAPKHSRLICPCSVL